MVERSVLKAIFKGLLTYFPGYERLRFLKKKKSKHSGSDAYFCYTFWLAFLKYLESKNIKADFEVVGELGTAGSFGMGLCALLTGSKMYYALEIEDLFSVDRNLELLEELLTLFRLKSNLSAKYKQLNIPISDFSYPAHLIIPLYEDDGYVQSLRDDIINFAKGKSKRIHLVLNWMNRDADMVDLVISRAVMEHVEYPSKVYSKLNCLIRNNGLMMHDIDLHSHGITKHPIGHLYIPKWMWKLIFGKRIYYLNRYTYKDHMDSVGKCFRLESVSPSPEISGCYTNGCMIIARKKSR